MAYSVPHARSILFTSQSTGPHSVRSTDGAFRKCRNCLAFARNGNYPVHRYPGRYWDPLPVEARHFSFSSTRFSQASVGFPAEIVSFISDSGSRARQQLQSQRWYKSIRGLQGPNYPPYSYEGHLVWHPRPSSIARVNTISDLLPGFVALLNTPLPIP